MRRIIGAAFISLDGVIQGPGGPTEDPTGGFAYSGWLPPLGDDAIDETIGTLFGRPFDLLLGRRTYDIFAGFWPFASDAMAGIRDPFNACTKYVLTRGAAPLAWNNSQRVGTIDALHAIKASAGPDLVVQGSSTLYPQLLAAGLLDELSLMISPLILGDGKRLFGNGTPPRTLRMTTHKVSTAGTIVATYRPAGAVETGTFATDEPSAAELDRRATMAGGRW